MKQETHTLTTVASWVSGCVPGATRSSWLNFTGRRSSKSGNGNSSGSRRCRLSSSLSSSSRLPRDFYGYVDNTDA